MTFPVIILPAITASLNNRLKRIAQKTDVSGVVEPLHFIWNSIPKSFRDRYKFTLIFLASLLSVVLFGILAD